MDSLDQQCDELIVRIKAVFPKFPYAKVKRYTVTAKHDHSYEAKKLEEMFTGKRWEDVVDNPHLIYAMGDIDFLRSMTGKAFVYFLPALFVAMLKEPYLVGEWLLHSNFTEKFLLNAHSLSLEQLQTLVAFYELQVEFWHDTLNERIVNEMEKRQLSVMLLIDERMASEKS
jgi:hypothetical protein